MRDGKPWHLREAFQWVFVGPDSKLRAIIVCQKKFSALTMISSASNRTPGLRANHPRSTS